MVGGGGGFERYPWAPSGSATVSKLLLPFDSAVTHDICQQRQDTAQNHSELAKPVFDNIIPKCIGK